MKAMRMRTNRGSLFLDAMVLGAVFAAATAMVFPILSGELNRDHVAEAESQLRQLRRAIEAFHMDVGAPPARLQDLAIAPAGVTNWLGPYVGRTFRDYDSSGLTSLADPWKQEFLLESGGNLVLTVRSCGANGVDDHGLGDDIAETFDLNRSAWEITRQELRLLRSAITAYDANVADPPLLGSWQHIVAMLQDQGLLPAGASAALDYQRDAWGNLYVPQGIPVDSVSTLGPQ